MLDVVAPHDHELALAVEIECIDNPEPGLPRPAIARQPQPPVQSGPDDDENQRRYGQQNDCHGEQDGALLENKFSVQPGISWLMRKKAATGKVI